MAGQAWWQTEVVYQIYPRSFADSNGDGIGDLPGITARIDHLVALGVGVVWLSPVYRSPMADNGYDISDYCDIAPEFGTLADFDALTTALHARGIKLVMDLVVNHCSDQHPWFEQGRQSRGHPWHDFFIWGEPAADGGPPNNWEACFSGPAWTFNPPTGEYYLHLFSPQQPDLDWRNPRLRAQVHEVLRFWLARGVDGFRMDVINLISKPWDAQGRLPDAPVVQPGPVQPAFAMVVHGPQLMDHLREMRQVMQAALPEGQALLTVGEAPIATTAQAVEITHPDTGALSMVFQFEHMDLDTQPGCAKWAVKPLHLPDLKAVMQRWQHALHGKGWNSLYLGNHDQPRIVSRWGDDSPAWRVRSATAWATWLHGLQGTPYVYQGEELGLPNTRIHTIADCQDIESINFHRAALARGDDEAVVMHGIRAKGRDNARTPFPWDGSDQGGFTTGTPWLAAHPRRAEVNAALALADPHSVFHHYRQLIALRRQHAVWVHGRTALLWPDHPQLAAYVRVLGVQRLRVLCNLSGQPVTFDLGTEAVLADAQLLLANQPDAPARVDGGSGPITLQAWEARIDLGRAG